MTDCQRRWETSRTGLRRCLAGAACLCILTAAGYAQNGTSDAGQQAQGSFDRAYQALKAREYDRAIGEFHNGLAQDPHNPAVHKDLAYALLKTGDNAEARDEFAEALKLNPHDETAGLEFGFLAFETKQPIEARRIFNKLRHSANSVTRATAEQAFQNIDRPLAEGIARWQEALRRLPHPDAIESYSAHWELAETAERRDDLPLAAEQYEICRRLKPQAGELLIDLARVWLQLNRVDESRAALLAASRSADARTAETALGLYGSRYPYPYEFLDALKLDPRNTALRRELGYLYLAMDKEPEATAQFETLLEIDPQDATIRRQLDLLRGLKTRPPVAKNRAPEQPVKTSEQVDAKALGKKSLAMGYLRDAVKYLQLAHEQNPDDAEVMLALGWAYNQSKDDAQALDWFDRARRSGDETVAPEASQAFHNLNGDTLPQTTIWTLPMFSSRWKDLFSYGQIKRTVPIPGAGKMNKIVSFYLSVRFIGDMKGALAGHIPASQYLSEDSFIFGAGVATKTWHHLTGWAEAGEAVKYLPQRHDLGAAIPDYRGGLNFAKGFGALLGGHNAGIFYETTDDAIYISRFDKDWLFYSQHRAGRTFQFSNGIAGQLLFNANYVRDSKSEYWANTLELGPGIKLRLPYMPPNMYLSADFLHGFYVGPPPPTQANGHPGALGYNDARISVWYAVTK